jgi:hypothetical protein
MNDRAPLPPDHRPIRWHTTPVALLSSAVASREVSTAVESEDLTCPELYHWLDALSTAPTARPLPLGPPRSPCSNECVLADCGAVVQIGDRGSAEQHLSVNGEEDLAGLRGAAAGVADRAAGAYPSRMPP